MKTSIHTQLTKAIVLAILVAGLAVPAAGAGTRSYPDAFGRAVNVHNAAAYPDAFGRAVNRSIASGQSSASQVASALGTPDTRDAAAAARESGSSQVVSSLGTPDTRDAAQLARSPVVRIVGSGGFSWGDASVGAGSGIGILLLLGIAGSMLVRQKHRLSRA